MLGKARRRIKSKKKSGHTALGSTCSACAGPSLPFSGWGWAVRGEKSTEKSGCLLGTLTNFVLRSALQHVSSYLLPREMLIVTCQILVSNWDWTSSWPKWRDCSILKAYGMQERPRERGLTGSMTRRESPVSTLQELVWSLSGKTCECVRWSQAVTPGLQLRHL